MLWACRRCLDLLSLTWHCESLIESKLPNVCPIITVSDFFVLFFESVVSVTGIDTSTVDAISDILNLCKKHVRRIRGARVALPTIRFFLTILTPLRTANFSCRECLPV